MVDDLPRLFCILTTLITSREPPSMLCPNLLDFRNGDSPIMDLRPKSEATSVYPNSLNSYYIYN